MASRSWNAMSEPPTLDPLLAHADWVRGLARSLTSDAAAADDLVQDTWAAALQQPPDARRPLRGWLATVLRRRARQGYRDAQRRRRRERRAARDEAEPATSDIVARAALHGELVQAVLALHEPYRRTILMRFFDGLPPRRIASVENVPVATVHSRITRGLGLLRGRLDVEHGGRRAWLLALPELRGPRPGSATPVTKALVPTAMGATLMNTYCKIGLVVGAGLVGLLLLDPWADPAAGVPRPETEREIAAMSAGLAAEAETGVTDAQPGEGRSPVHGAPTDAPAAPRMVSGRVLDVSGNPLADVAVGWSGDRGEPGPEVVRSGPDGTFELPDEVPGHVLLATDPLWFTLLAGTPWVAGRNEVVLVVAPRNTLGGTVLDEEGRPLASASITFNPPFDFGSEFGRVLDNSMRMHRDATSDDRGRFRIQVPVLAEGTLRFAADGFVAHAEPLPVQATTGLQVVMRRVRPAVGSLRGVVLGPTGSVVPGARVSNGAVTVRTDGEGAFALELPADGERITAVHEGFLPAFAEPEPGPDGGPQWPDHLLLQLGGRAPRSISGRVVDAEASPLAGIKVWLADPTYFGPIDGTVLQVETVIGGENRMWAYRHTGADGSFRIEGLLDRPYRLGAIDPDNLLGAAAGPVPAGSTGVEIILPTDRVFGTLRGRVVTRSGEPVPDVRVNCSHITFETRVPGGTTDAFEESVPVRSDRDGRFVLENVPVEGVHLRVTGDAVMPFHLESAEIGDPENVELVVSLRHHVQVELVGDPSRADTVRLLEADDRPALLRVMRGGGSYTNRYAELTDGRSHVISVADSAVAVAFYKGDAEVHRIPLNLVTGQVNRVRW